MKCPHCLEHFYMENSVVSGSPGTRNYLDLGVDVQGHWWLERVQCPACRRIVLALLTNEQSPVTLSLPDRFYEHYERVRPRGSSRPPMPVEVPPEFREDYLEASLVLPFSAKASAALSRRCLQHLLREKVGVKGGTLYEEIEQAKNQNVLPSSIVDLLDVPRKVGNDAAHPMKHPATGEIVDVELSEAEWCLEVIEALYDHLFVQPAKNAERRRRLEERRT